MRLPWWCGCTWWGSGCLGANKRHRWDWNPNSPILGSAPLASVPQRNPVLDMPGCLSKDSIQRPQLSSLGLFLPEEQYSWNSITRYLLALSALYFHSSWRASVLLNSSFVYLLLYITPSKLNVEVVLHPRILDSKETSSETFTSIDKQAQMM